jgi:hypothetical protein
MQMAAPAMSGLAVSLSIEWHLAQFALAKVKPPPRRRGNHKFAGSVDR